MSGRVDVRRVWTENGFKAAIIERNLGSPAIDSWFTAYIGVPENHVAAQIRDYEDIPLNVHGGLTYGHESLDKVDPEGDSEYYWIGWDYNHGKVSDGITLNDVVTDVMEALEQAEDMTVRDAVKHKIRFMPDWFKESVKILEVEEP